MMFVLPRTSVLSFGCRVSRIPSGTPIENRKQHRHANQPEMFASKHRDFAFVSE